MTCLLRNVDKSLLETGFYYQVAHKKLN